MADRKTAPAAAALVRVRIAPGQALAGAGFIRTAGGEWECSQSEADSLITAGIAEPLHQIAVRAAAKAGVGLSGGGPAVQAACREAGVPWVAAAAAK